MAASGRADPALQEYHETGEYADMELVIRSATRDPQAPGSGGCSAAPEAGVRTRSAKRQRGPSPPPPLVLHTVPAHRLVLATQSAWAKAMLNIVQPPQGGQPRLELAVEDEEEGAAALLLVRTLYTAGGPGSPLEGQPQLTLLRVLRLADRLQAPHAAAAAAAALTAAPLLEWDTVQAVLLLPLGCASQPAYAPVFKAAARAAQERLAKFHPELAGSDGEAALLLCRAAVASDARAALEGQPQLTLLRVLCLTERLLDPRVAAAAADARPAAPAREWDTALAVWARPDGGGDNPALEPVFVAALKAVQARLGDLDRALARSSRRKALLGLPLAALVALLRSDATRASSENVAYYVCSKWLSQFGGSMPAEEAALAACVRLHRMSPLYLTTIVGCTTALVEGVTRWVPRKAQAQAVLWLTSSKSMRKRLMRQGGAEQLQAQRRPKSHLRRGAIEWALPLAELRALHEETAAKGVGRAASKHSPWAPWGGLDWRLQLQAVHREGGVEMGLYLLPCTPLMCDTGDGMAAANFAIACGSVSKSKRPQVFESVSFLAEASADSAAAHAVTKSCKGWPGFFGLGARAEWDEGAWRAAGLVGDGDVVKMTATIGRLA